MFSVALARESADISCEDGNLEVTAGPCVVPEQDELGCFSNSPPLPPDVTVGLAEDGAVVVTAEVADDGCSLDRGERPLVFEEAALSCSLALSQARDTAVGGAKSNDAPRCDSAAAPLCIIAAIGVGTW